MPGVSRFFGIVIYMYYNDHSPAHFHAVYGDAEAVYTIETLEIMREDLPRRAHAMVVEWAVIHRPELRENWQRARDMNTLKQIEPLL